MSYKTLNLSIIQQFKELGTQRLGNWVCFRPHVNGTPTLLVIPKSRRVPAHLKKETHPVLNTLCSLVRPFDIGR
jgi:hypothetical protein